MTALPSGHRGRLGQVLPAWSAALAVIAHPDDESFGLGAVISALAAAGTAVHILCYTHGEASTLNETHADLHRARQEELRRAAAELGAVGVTLLGYPDGGLWRRLQLQGDCEYLRWLVPPGAASTASPAGAR